MRKGEDGPTWDVEGFNRVLDDLSFEAGIPATKRGVPNSVAFYEATGVDTSSRSRWRSGQQQPTVELLRKVAAAVGGRTGHQPEQILMRLEVLAGRRSESEAQAAGMLPTDFTPDEARTLIARTDEILAIPTLSDDVRERYQGMRNSAIELLRTIVERHEQSGGAA